MSSESESESFTGDTPKDNHSPGVETYINRKCVQTVFLDIKRFLGISVFEISLDDCTQKEITSQTD